MLCSHLCGTELNARFNIFVMPHHYYYFFLSVFSSVQNSAFKDFFSLYANY